MIYFGRISTSLRAAEVRNALLKYLRIFEADLQHLSANGLN